MVMHRTSVIAAVVAFLLVSGCGDDESGDAVARDVFQRDVNALCQEEHTRVDAMFEGFPEEPTKSDMQDLIGAFAESFREYRDGLVAVGPPDGQEAEYDKYLDLVDSHLETLDRGAADPDEAERLFNEEGDDPMAEIEEELGLDVCASR